MSSNVTARKNCFLEKAETLKKKVQTYDGGKSIYLHISDCETAWVWDGKPKYSSWYA